MMSASNRLNNISALILEWAGTIAATMSSSLGRVSRFGRFAFELACAAAIAFSASNIALTLMTPTNIGAAEQTGFETSTRNSETALQPGSFAQQVFFKSLDGRATALAETNAKIKLFGTRPSANGFGSAIVSVNGGAQESVSTGDRLKNGARITGIFPDRIEISASGEAGAVYLLPAKQRNQRKLVSKISGTELSLLAQLFDLQITGSAARLGPNADSSLLAGLGLAAGDKIIAADNAPMNDEAALEAAFNRLINGNNVSLEITRGDAKIIKIIAAADVAAILGGL